MLRGMTSRQASLIGCVVAGDHVRLAQRVRGRRGSEKLLTACASIDVTGSTPRSTAITAAVRRARLSTTFVGRRAGTVLESRDVTCRTIILEQASSEDALDAARRGVLDELDGPPDAWSVDCMPIGPPHEKGGRHAVLVFAAPVAALHTHLMPLEDAGLTIETIDAAPLVTGRVFHGAFGSENPSLVLNLCRATPTLSIAAGSRPWLLREIRGLQGEREPHEPWNHATPSQFEDLKHQIELHLQYLREAYPRVPAVRAGCVLASTAAAQRACMHLSAIRGIDFRIASDLWSQTASADEPDPLDWHLALGLTDFPRREGVETRRATA